MRTTNISRPSRSALASAPPLAWRAERGAMLVNAAIAMVGLISFSALVVDYGILWAARRQAQNAADAGAMAAAVSLAYVSLDNQALARTSALNTARANYIWGVQPDIVDADVTFPPCPPGSPGAGTNACVRVDVFRNQRPGGSPLPTIFGRLAGVVDQGVKATATAEVLYGDASTCVKPWAIPDKWEERNPTPTAWDPADNFNRYTTGGGLLSPADFYQPPGPSAINGGNGTGFTTASVTTGGDYGLQITLKQGSPTTAIAPGWFYPVVVDPDCRGGNCYRDAIAGCAPLRYGDGRETLTTEPGNMIGPTQQGVEDLIALDPDAYWEDPDGDGGPLRGYVDGGCLEAHTCIKSPRLVAVPIFDVDLYDLGKASGRQDIVITKVMGFFIERMNGNDVVGRLCFYPGEPYVSATGTSGPPGSSFIVSIALVR
jgi:hypothetical protein